jgi:hypothetical protein
MRKYSMGEIMAGGGASNAAHTLVKAYTRTGSANTEGFADISIVQRQMDPRQLSAMPQDLA